MKLRLLLFQLAQLSQNLYHIRTLRKLQPVGQHRRKHRQTVFTLRSQPLACKSPVKPCHRADLPGLSLLRQFKDRSIIYSQLIRLFLPDLLTGSRTAAIAHRHLHPKHSSCHLQVG